MKNNQIEITPVSRDEIARCESAMFSPAFPCNPRPFARSLVGYLCAAESSSAIEDDTAKRLLWVLNAMAYGQLAQIDLCDEWRRLES
jgi:hypothetical protein